MLSVWLRRTGVRCTGELHEDTYSYPSLTVPTTLVPMPTSVPGTSFSIVPVPASTVLVPIHRRRQLYPCSFDSPCHQTIGSQERNYWIQSFSCWDLMAGCAVDLSQNEVWLLWWALPMKLSKFTVEFCENCSAFGPVEDNSFSCCSIVIPLPVQ